MSAASSSTEGSARAGRGHVRGRFLRPCWCWCRCGDTRYRPWTPPTIKAESSGDPENGAEPALTPGCRTGRLPAETVTRSTITQIYEGTNQIQRMVMARQLLKGW
jgi:hypothetical protein